jgi:hypothetical protein
MSPFLQQLVFFAGFTTTLTTVLGGTLIFLLHRYDHPYLHLDNKEETKKD